MKRGLCQVAALVSFSIRRGGPNSKIHLARVPDRGPSFMRDSKTSAEAGWATKVVKLMSSLDGAETDILARMKG